LLDARSGLLMSLTESEVASLEVLLEETEVLIVRCEDRLLTVEEASRSLSNLWQRSLAIVPPHSDEWRLLDRIKREGDNWWRVESSGYVASRDAAHFAKLRNALNRIIERSGPEFLRSRGRTKTQRFFAAGEEYEARKAIFAVMKSATSRLAVVDQYLDEMVFDYLASLEPSIRLELVTGEHKPIFRTLFVAFSAKHGNVEARMHDACHDRFILVDGIRAVHLGASINTLGKRAFMLNEVIDEEEFRKLLTNFDVWWAEGQRVS